MELIRELLSTSTVIDAVEVCFTRPIQIVACFDSHVLLPRDAMLVRYMLSSCVRPSVCPSATLTSWYWNETTGRIELVFGTWRLPSTYPTLCYRLNEIRVSPSGTLSWTRTSKISPRQVDRVVNNTRRRRRSSLLTTPRYDSRRVVAVYYKSVNCNPLTTAILVRSSV